MAGADLSRVDFTWGDRVVYERQILHVYNHTDPTGKGYHFDALVEATAKDVPGSTCAETVASATQEPATAEAVPRKGASKSPMMQAESGKQAADDAGEASGSQPGVAAGSRRCKKRGVRDAVEEL